MVTGLSSAATAIRARARARSAAFPKIILRNGRIVAGRTFRPEEIREEKLQELGRKGISKEEFDRLRDPSKGFAENVGLVEKKVKEQQVEETRQRSATGRLSKDIVAPRPITDTQFHSRFPGAARRVHPITGKESFVAVPSRVDEDFIARDISRRRERLEADKTATMISAAPSEFKKVIQRVERVRGAIRDRTEDIKEEFTTFKFNPFAERLERERPRGGGISSFFGALGTSGRVAEPQLRKTGETISGGLLAGGVVGALSILPAAVTTVPVLTAGTEVVRSTVTGETTTPKRILLTAGTLKGIQVGFGLFGRTVAKAGEQAKNLQAQQQAASTTSPFLETIPKGKVIDVSIKKSVPRQQRVTPTRDFEGQEPGDLARFVRAISIKGKKGAIRGSKRILSKAELRKKSRGQQADPRFFRDLQKGEVGFRKGQVTLRTDVKGTRIIETKPPRGQVQVAEKIVTRGVVTPKKGTPLEDRVTKFIQPVLVGRPKVRETFRRGQEPVKEILFPTRPTGGKIPKTQDPTLSARRKAAGTIQKFLESGEGIKGVLVARQKPKTPLSFTFKREPTKTPSSITSPPLVSRQLPKNKLIREPKRKGEILSKKEKRQGVELQRTGFRAGQFEKLKAKLSAKRRDFVLIEPAQQVPTVSLPALIGKRGLARTPTGLTTPSLKATLGTSVDGAFATLPDARVGTRSRESLLFRPALSKRTRIVPIIGIGQSPSQDLGVAQAQDVATAQDVDSLQDVGLFQEQDSILDSQFEEPTRPIGGFIFDGGDGGGRPPPPEDTFKPPRDKPPREKPPRDKPPKKPTTDVPPPTTIILSGASSINEFVKRKSKVSQGYDTLIREKGKFFKANKQPLPRRKAFNLGSDVVDNSSAATFTIRKSGRTKVPDDVNLLRYFKFEQKNNLFIERNRHRIDSFGERQQITAKGLLAVRRKRMNAF